MVMAVFKSQMNIKLAGHPVSLKYLPNHHPHLYANFFQDSRDLTQLKGALLLDVDTVGESGSSARAIVPAAVGCPCALRGWCFS